jgi:ribosome-associated protein
LKAVIPKKVKQTKTPVWSARKKALQIAKLSQAKQAGDVVLLKVGTLSSIADYYVICTAGSEPQIRAIVDGVEMALSKEGIRPLSMEGAQVAQWVIVDYNDVILHIFREEARLFYNLDRLWGDAPKTCIADKPLKGKKRVISSKKRKL